MGGIASLVINDAAAAAVTFAPVQPMNNDAPAYWTNRNDSLLAGKKDIKLSIVENNAGTTRVKGTITLPVVVTDSTTGLKRVQHNDLANFEFVLPSSSALADRKDLYAFVKGFVSSSVVQTAVEQFERQY